MLLFYLKVPRDVRSSKSGNITYLGKTSVNKVTNRTGPGVRNCKILLLASHTHYNCFMESPRTFVIRSRSLLRSSLLHVTRPRVCLMSGGGDCQIVRKKWKGLLY